MSEKDRFDWNEDEDFDWETGVADKIDDYEDPLDGFADFEDLSDYDDLTGSAASDADSEERQAGLKSDTTEAAKEGLSEKIPADTAAAAALKKQKRRRGLSATGMGILFTVSILVAGVGVGGAILLVQGVHPASLWQPQNLLQIDQLLNFADHPLNILYMVTMGIVFLALLGSYKMSKAAVEANARTREAENMLDRLTALSLDKQEEWQSQEFKEFPPAEAFVIRTLGAWRLQKARQKRLMGVEGELHRLEKALNTNSRSDLTGRFDHPAVGRLADEMIRYFDARDTAVRKLEDYESQELEFNTNFMDSLKDSREWNGATLDQLGVQCASLDDLAGQMDDLAKHVEKLSVDDSATQGLTDIIEGIRRDIARQSSGSLADDQMTTDLNDLVDRGSKLAFKIAMEVARLGPRGERLLPMSQSLEDLTTGFRQLTDRVNDQDTGPSGAQALKSVHKKLDTLAALITQDDQSPWQDLVDEVQDFGPALEGFNEQEDRLVRLGTSYAKVTGAEFDSNSIPRKDSSDAPVATLNITGDRVPAGPTDESLSPEPPSPFATSDGPILPQEDFQQSDSDFRSPIIPEMEPADDGMEDTLEVSRPESKPRFSLTPEPSGDMPLPEEEETVYDLEDFTASPVTDPGSSEVEQTFDLSDFGAVPVTEEDNSDQVFELSDFDSVPMQDEIDSDTVSADESETVYDLSAFGASPASPAEPASQEDVYDLSEFGASPLDQVSGAELEDTTVEEDVVDLTDLGAKPMN
jgi:hypothetical protein